MLCLVNELMVEECINLICDGPPTAISEVHLTFYDRFENI